MLFCLSTERAGRSVWYSIYPLAQPDIWVRSGWPSAAGSFPKAANGEETRIECAPEDLAVEMFSVVEDCILPFFKRCASLDDLIDLHRQGGESRARYPIAFALLSMGRTEEGQWLLHELTEDFDTDKRWDKATRDHVWKYVRMQTAAELSCSLDSERSANLRKHGLVRLARTKG
jgi:hypothetical protein